MTKGTDTYGLGIGIQLGPSSGSGTSRSGAPAAVPDGRPEGDEHQSSGSRRHHEGRRPLQAGYRPAVGTYNYDTAPAAWVAGKIAIYSSDLATTTTSGRSRRSTGCSCPIRPAAPTARSSSRHRLLRDGPQDPRQGPGLGGHQVLDEQRQRRVLDGPFGNLSVAYGRGRPAMARPRRSSWRQPSPSSRRQHGPRALRGVGRLRDQAEEQIEDCLDGQAERPGRRGQRRGGSQEDRPPDDLAHVQGGVARRRVTGATSRARRGSP